MNEHLEALHVAAVVEGLCDEIAPRWGVRTERLRKEYGARLKDDRMVWQIKHGARGFWTQVRNQIIAVAADLRGVRLP